MSFVTLKTCLTVMTLCSLYLTLCAGNKYSKKSNIKLTENSDVNFDEEINPFRMQKVKLLWEKSKKRLSGQKLAELYADLKIHDKHEAELKKMRVGDLDFNKKMETKVMQNYKRIVERYALDEFLGLESTYISNEIPSDDDELTTEKEIYFQDPKLQNMWKRAEESGFSEENLNMLKEEFFHHQTKINEFTSAHGNLHAIADFDDNSVDTEQQKLNLSPKEAKERKASMKENKKAIQEGYMKLEHMASNMPSLEPVFLDLRVQKLWAMAKKTNWSEEELTSFREELKHFEHRLKKQTYYSEQLELSQLSLDNQEEENLSEKYQHLQEKSQNIAQKVRKIHGDLKTRVDKALRHSEL